MRTLQSKQNSSFPCLASLMLILILAALQFSCENEGSERKAGQSSFALTCGEPTYDHPAVGCLIKYGPECVCSGTLLTPRIFITAGHCYSSDANEVYFRRSESEYWQYYHVVAHYLLNDEPILGSEDLAILVLESDVEGIEPIGLWPDNPQSLVGKTIRQIGYGGIDGSNTSRIKNYRWNTVKHMEENWLSLVAEYELDPDCGTQNGDSGSPALIYTSDGIPLVAGVASTGASSQEKYSAIVGTNRDWILDVLEDEGIDIGALEADQDGVYDNIDNCPADPNTYQGPGIDDNESCPSGIGDGRGRSCDNCAALCNPDQADSEMRIDSQGYILYLSDGTGDVCDGCPRDPSKAPLIFPGTDWDPDRDDDGLADECDFCPRVHPSYFGEEDNRYDDRYNANLNDEDNDGIADRCDNCRNQENSDQANCNWFYEKELYHLPDVFSEYPFGKGDACDPDPCPALCDESDPSSVLGECSFTIEESPDIIRLGGTMWNTHTTIGTHAVLDHYDAGYFPASFTNPRTGERIQIPIKLEEGQQIYHCSCWHPVYGWLNEEDCSDIDIGPCKETGRENRLANDYPISGWFETIKPEDYEFVECDFPSDTPCSLPTCSPWEEGDNPYECAFHGGRPHLTDYWGLPRSENWKQTTILWRNGYIRYPEGTDHDYQELKFWIRPIGRTGMENPATYMPPSSNWGDLSSDPNWPNWNNLYTPSQVLRYIDLPIGHAHLGELSDGDNLRKLRDWRDGVPQGAKDRIIIPDVFYWADGDCPPWLAELCYFDVTVQDSALRGIAFLEFDAHSRSFMKLVPSRSMQQQVPGERDMAMTMMRMPSLQGEAIIFAFGGENAAGVLSNRTWIAIKQDMGPSGEAYYWQMLDVPGEKPPARKNALMFTDPSGENIYLVGGESENGLLDDMWVLSIESPQHDVLFAEDGTLEYVAPGWSWSRYYPEGDPLGARSQMSASVDGMSVAIYGGETEDCTSGDVFIFHPAFDRLTRILTADGVPIARRDASIEYDLHKNSLYLYGGSENGVLYNDLWKLDLSTRQWNLLLPDCHAGTCPLPAEDSILVKDSIEGSLTLIAGRVSASKETYYVPGDSIWTGQGQYEGLERAGDCDGDGVANQGYGLLCSSGERWWSAPGISTCDSFTGSLTCSLEELEGMEAGTISVPGATSFDVEGNWLWVTRGRRLEGYDVHDASAPLLVAELRLPGTARDVKLKGGYAYVACDRRVMIVDVRNPSDPYVVSEMATCGTAREVDIVDSTLAIASSGGIGIISVSVPSAPRGLGMLWVHETGRETITHEGSMDECAQISEEEQDWIDGQGIFGGFGRIFEGENHTLYAASRHALMSFYIMNNGIASLAGRLDYRSPIEAMRVFGTFAYLAVRPHGYVIVDVSDSGNMLEAGSHDIAWWVSGQEIEKDRVYVLDGNMLKIAMVSPEMGWIWQ